MNICLCITNFKSDLVEAISKTAVDAARALNENADCVLYTPGEIASDTWQGEQRPKHVSFAPDRDYHSKVRVFRNIVDLGRHLRASPGKFDIVHFHVGNLLELFLIRLFVPNLGAVKIATVWQPYLGFGEFFRLPWIFGRQWPAVAHHYLFNSWLHVPLFMFGAGYFDRICVHTRHQRRQLSFVPDGKARTIVNGVAAPEAPPPRKSGPPSVLYIGHATAVKGLDTLLSALGRARDRAPFRATLALTAFQNVDVKKLLRENGLEDRVTIKGHVDVFDEMHRHGVLVVPHKTSLGTSCYPNIVLEALSAGIPVVASETNVLAEIIEDRVTGFLVPPGDVRALERVLVELFNGSADAESMSERQQAAFRERFTLERYVAGNLQMYEEALNTTSAKIETGISGQHS